MDEALDEFGHQGLHVDALRSQIRLNKPQGVGNQFFDLRGFGAPCPLLAEIKHALGHLFDSPRSALDDLEVDAKRMVRRQTFFDETNMSADEHQWIGDLMSKTCR